MDIKEIKHELAEVPAEEVDTVSRALAEEILKNPNTTDSTPFVKDCFVNAIVRQFETKNRIVVQMMVSRDWVAVSKSWFGGSSSIISASYTRVGNSIQQYLTNVRQALN